jgi:hypothetical protein
LNFILYSSQQFNYVTEADFEEIRAHTEALPGHLSGTTVEYNVIPNQDRSSDGEMSKHTDLKQKGRLNWGI